MQTLKNIVLYTIFLKKSLELCCTKTTQKQTNKNQIKQEKTAHPVYSGNDRMSSVQCTGQRFIQIGTQEDKIYYLMYIPHVSSKGFTISLKNFEGKEYSVPRKSSKLKKKKKKACVQK